MTDNLKKLRAKLTEMFQLDQADLDFGIYRVMNLRRDEIIRFLDQDLIPQVRMVLGASVSSDRAAKVAELKKRVVDSFGDAAVQDDGSLGDMFASTPLGKEYTGALAASREQGDADTLENEVFSHLFSFFNRYYKDGDFISLRRYREGVYAIPYEGEEVKLYWANHDQYYIKTGEYFQDYAFRLSDGRRVHFRLVDASTEKDNVKAEAGKERRFIYTNQFELSDDGQELSLQFVYQPDEKKRNQTRLSEEAARTILADTELRSWLSGLGTLAPTAKNAKRTLLEKHLAAYTARNTFDYFIHKDLGGFLRRELDFYIKSEVLHLDDVENANPAQYERLLSTVKAIRQIAHKIIRFLAQLEDFQKKLWLKKKFVIETNYCITLDRVPEELYAEIAANEAQWREWEKLGFLTAKHAKGAKGETKKGKDGQNDLFEQAGVKLAEGTGAESAEPRTVEYLQQNPFLVLDTAFFDDAFRARLLAAIPDLDTQCGGLLIHSENFQALSAMQKRYREQVKCVYIDPPYNTGGDGFLYKDSYQHSSWLAVLSDRVHESSGLLGSDGAMYVSLDDAEHAYLKALLDHSLGRENFIANIIWEKNFSPRNTAKHYSENHDYVLCYARRIDDFRIGLLPRTKEAVARYTNPDDDPRGPWTSGDLTARNYYSEGTYEVVGPTGRTFRPVVGNYWRISKNKFEKLDNEGRVYWGESGDNMPRLKRYLSDVKDGMTPVTLWKHKEVGHTQEAKREVTSRITFESSGDVFNTIKPTRLIRRVCQTGGVGTGELVLDYFAGSGTTGHAVIDLNREDGGSRRYILVEMGDYFDTVLKPRIQKVVFSQSWKDGKPVPQVKPDDPANPYGGVSHCFKYIRLESYEDTLDNLQLSRSDVQDALLSEHDALREDYMLGYMLDLEAQGSASLLNTDSFKNPFDYRLKIRRDDELKETPVHLIETFNWLIGLRVRHIDIPQSFTADFERDDYGKFQVKGRLKQDDTGPWTLRRVEGTAPDGSRVLILWRTLTGNVEEDNAVLDAWFDRNCLSTRDTEFDIVYVNGDNTLPNLRRPDETWKVRLLEEEFHKRMWEDTE